MYKIIKPVIDIEMKPMSNLRKETQEFICTCETKCKNYVVIDDYGRYCENDAREIALSIYSIIEGIQRVESTNKKRGWSYKEEKFIVDWYKRRGGKALYGDTRLIASMLNRPLPKTKNYINYLRRKGKI